MEESPEPGLQPIFSLSLVTADPTVVGTLATGGLRRHCAVVGGYLEGAGLHAQIIPGHGGETWLERADATAVLETNYLVRMADGCIARLIGNGYFTGAPHYSGTRLTLMFEVDEHGPVAWLATRVFVGERPAGAGTFDIAMVV